ncbi:F-box protein [Cocos nucifera]|uniref:F-box protein n=1 Tax=Cocos nucifera TaxID=13894 RepID=A0A8K0I123_COCNU|nr:F-box protein [Cocos nucifera]
MPSVFHSLTSPHLCRKKLKKRRRNPTKTLTLNPSRKPPTPNLEPQVSGREEAEEPLEEEEEEEVGFKLRPSASSRSFAVQPLGNLFLLDPCANARNSGLGALRVLSDELLLDILGLLCGRDVAVLSAVSRSFYVFAGHEPLWKNLVLEELKGDFLFDGSWKSTYVSGIAPRSAPSHGAAITIRNFYSDYLFQSWLCANLEMKPEWLERDNIERRRGISVEEFVESFEEPNRPVLLEGCLESWPAMEKWTWEQLVKVCGDVKFAAGPVEMTLERYFRYADSAREERPLYLFDPNFAKKVPEMGSDYEVPVYFREDLFSFLGEERPDYRWVIIGPAGSGSSFHVDPNSTSAWNAVIKGSKKWVMFPPEIVPPGVHPSPDGAEVACPVSIMEWFMNFYGACKNWKRRPIECICRTGEVVFVPNGWWHLVINLEDSVAITQNYVSRRNLLNVLDFLGRPNASELVSGTKDRVNLYDKFRNAIDAAFPGTIDQLRQKAHEKMTQKKKLTFWESVSDANAGGFKFSF